MALTQETPYITPKTTKKVPIVERKCISTATISKFAETLEVTDIDEKEFYFKEVTHETQTPQEFAGKWRKDKKNKNKTENKETEEESIEELKQEVEKAIQEQEDANKKCNSRVRNLINEIESKIKENGKAKQKVVKKTEEVEREETKGKEKKEEKAESENAEENNSVKWDHPFSVFESVEEAQQMFREVQSNPQMSIDTMHFKSNQDLVKKAFKRVVDRHKNADLILSDSCTCTKDWVYDEYWQNWYEYEDRKGTEFRNEFQTNETNWEYVPEWGKGLEEINERIKYAKSQNPNIKDIVIFCAGNDIYIGEKHIAKMS